MKRKKISRRYKYKAKKSFSKNKERAKKLYGKGKVAYVKGKPYAVKMVHSGKKVLKYLEKL